MRAGTGIALSALAAAGLVAPLARADESEVRNQVSFSVERSREVETDWVTAVVGATHEDVDPGAVAERINSEMDWGTGIAKAVRGIRLRTGGYTTRPIDDPKRGQLRRWRGTQTLVLEGADPKAMSELIGKLQARLQLQNIAFSVSPERRRSVADELLDEALDAFRGRAERVRTRLGAKSYEIVSIRLDAAGMPPPRPMARAMMMAEAAAPPLEAGTSTLRASAQATIELGF